MTRVIPAGVLPLLSNETQYCHILLTLETAGAPMRAWTGIGDLNYASNTYTGLGDFITVSPVDEAADLTAFSVDFTLSGVPADYVSLALTERIRGRTMTLDWAWFTDGSFSTVAGVVTVYRGRASRWRVSDDGAAASITLTTENRLIEAQRATNRTWTPEDQRSFVNSNDAFFDNVAAIQELDLGSWGSQ